MLKPASLCILLLASLAGAQAQSGPPIRSEAPIRETVLSDGTRRYAVSIKIGDATMDAGLDTGSTGLRVLAGALGNGDVATSGNGEQFVYGSGTELDGTDGEATVSIGGSSGSATIQVVQSVSCASDHPHCPASHVAFAHFGIQGDGLPDEGFKAILGINMARAVVSNPLAAIGARRWIVELPRPGEDNPGRLILNPNDAEIADFIMLPTIARFREERGGGLHDAVRGCIQNEATKEKACGPLAMDTGAPGIEIRNPGLGHGPWPEGTPALLAFYDADGLRAAVQLTVGLRAQASRLSFEIGNSFGPVIYSGLTAYFAYSVFYDPTANRIGLRGRAAAKDGPTAVAIPSPG